jgi:hypothetical protein
MLDEKEGRPGGTAEGGKFANSEPTLKMTSSTTQLKRTFADFVVVVDIADRFYIDQDKAIGTPKYDLMTDLVMATQEGRLEFPTLESLLAWVRKEGTEMREHEQRIRMQGNRPSCVR